MGEKEKERRSERERTNLESEKQREKNEKNSETEKKNKTKKREQAATISGDSPSFSPTRVWRKASYELVPQMIKTQKLEPRLFLPISNAPGCTRDVPLKKIPSALIPR